MHYFATYINIDYSCVCNETRLCYIDIKYSIDIRAYIQKSFITHDRNPGCNVPLPDFVGLINN